MTAKILVTLRAIMHHRNNNSIVPTMKQPKKACSPLLYTSIILVAFLAIWLGMPQKQLDWNGEILPMAHEKMNLSTPTDTPLEDMIVVLTGSTSGIGLALTKTLVKLGATVVALGRSASKITSTPRICSLKCRTHCCRL